MGRLNRVDRVYTIEALFERDGDGCFYCKKFFDHISEVTIDHYYPVSYGKKMQWSHRLIWGFSNLRASCQPCNAKKGNTVPQSESSLTRKILHAPKVRKKKPCRECEEGRKLKKGMTCEACNKGPLPKIRPRYMKRQPKDCDHANYWCFLCSSGLVDRVNE